MPLDLVEKNHYKVKLALARNRNNDWYEICWIDFRNNNKAESHGSLGRIRK